MYAFDSSTRMQGKRKDGCIRLQLINEFDVNTWMHLIDIHTAILHKLNQASNPSKCAY